MWKINFLSLSLVWLGSRQQVEKIDELKVPILLSSVTTVDTVRDLGVITDRHLTMSRMSAPFVGLHISSGASYVKSGD